MAGNWFKRAQRGLYAGKTILFGNNVSFSHRRTRRSWLPNVVKKTLFSQILNQRIPIRLTTHALRWIDKAGGLDHYLLTTPARKLQSEFGSKLRSKLLAAYQEQHGVKFDPKPLILEKRAERLERTIRNQAAKAARQVELEKQQQAAREKAAREAEEAAAAAAAARSLRASKSGKQQEKKSAVKSDKAATAPRIAEKPTQKADAAE